MKASGLLVFACVAALGVGCNGRRTDNAIANNANGGATADTAGTAGSISSGDKNFVNDQLSGGMAEVQIAQLTKDHAASPEVKEFGQMMIDDHTKAGTELKQVAAQYNVDTVDESKEFDKHKDAMDRLSKLRGGEFDKEYVKAMVDDHQNAVDSLESRVDSTASLKDKITDKDAKDTQVIPEKTDNAVAASVNQWAAQALPVVRHHLDEARALNDTLDRNGRVNETARNDKVRRAK